MKRRWWLIAIGPVVVAAAIWLARPAERDPFVGVMPYVTKDTSGYDSFGNIYWMPHSKYSQSRRTTYRVRKLTLQGIGKEQVLVLLKKALPEEDGWLAPPVTENDGLVWFGCEKKPRSNGASVRNVTVVGPVTGKDDGSHEIELADYAPLSGFDILMLRVKALGRDPTKVSK